MRPDDGRDVPPIGAPMHTHKEKDAMTFHTDRDHRDRGLGGARALIAVLGALVFALALAACGSSSSSTSSGSSSGSSTAGGAASGGVATAASQLAPFNAAPTKIVISQPLKSKPPTGKKLVMLGTADPNNVKLQKSLKNLAGLAGWSYDQVSYDPANPATFNQAIDTAITKKANYIAEAGIPLTPAAISKVKNAGAKWVLTSVAPADVKDPVIVNANSAANDGQMGKVLADYFVSDSKGKGNILMEHVPAYPILSAFTDAFKAEVSKLCPACKVNIQNITIPDLAAGKVPSIMVSALRKNPDANYMGFDVGPFANGVDSALAAAGLSNKVKMIGQAADEAALANIKSGKHAAWTGFDPVYSTYVMMDSMFRDAEGMPIDENKAGLQPTQIITKANAPSSSTWSEPTDALNQFKQLWQLQ
jgi:ribose transport system substrate-binding protein